ncbi:MAG: hypothetical protein IKX63_02705 [Muribaculaceae bacterium]|nr:hypothetical protein [Muribaculaceae bacterium]
MKKVLFLSISLICCILMGMSLSSCGDDEPIISSNIDMSELTTPMFLFEQPSSGVVSTISNGFSFWSFNNEKAAHGTFYFNGNRAMLKCNELHSTWSLNDGKLILSNTSHNIKKVTALGVKAFTIDLTIYIPSNLTISNFKAETIFTELSLNKEKLWQGLEKAKAEGSIYLDEL